MEKSDVKGKYIDLNGGDWVKKILRPALSKKTPKDVAYLFEVARGSMCYGFYFYPLFSMASEQLHDVSTFFRTVY